MSRDIVSPFFSPLWSNSGWTLLIAFAFEDGEGVKIDRAIWVSKAGSLVSYDESALVASSVFGSEFGLVVRSGDGMGLVYSPLTSSPSKVGNIAS